MTAPGADPHVLREYALIADGERGALVGPRGDLCWMCAPRWHSGAVFSSLLGGHGSFSVCPRGRFVWGGRYEPDSLIWRCSWVTDEGIVECRDALALPTARDRATILRQVIAREGSARVRALLDVGADFGRHGLADLARDGDAWTGRSGGLRVRVRGAAGARLVDGERPVLAQDLDLEAGGHHDLVVEIGAGALPEPPPPPEELWRRTEAAWAGRAPALPRALGERDARHAAAVLRGLTSADGGMVAAATAGLPERAEQGRNYDYRFAWIRDQCFAGQAAIAAGIDDLADAAVAFVSERLLRDGPRLRPAYTVDGGPVPGEAELPLPGYPGGHPRTGNRVNAQFQLDVFGEALLLLAAAARAGRLGPEGRRAAAAAADAIAARWREPDAGIWEIEPRAWTHSRLICVAGLRAAEATLGRRADVDRLADRIMEDAVRHGTSEGRWRRAYDDDRVDSALLLPLARGAPPRDRRGLATLRAVQDELTEDGYVYRFRPDGRPLGEAEGAFLLCSLALAMVERLTGDREGALRRFERARAACGPPGLYSEEWDVGQRQMRANLPQAFVHALLLECAVAFAAG